MMCCVRRTRLMCVGMCATTMMKCPVLWLTRASETAARIGHRRCSSFLASSGQSMRRMVERQRRVVTEQVERYKNARGFAPAIPALALQGHRLMKPRGAPLEHLGAEGHRRVEKVRIRRVGDLHDHCG